MKAEKLAILPRLTCPYKEHRLVDLPFSVPFYKPKSSPLWGKIGKTTILPGFCKIQRGGDCGGNGAPEKGLLNLVSLKRKEHMTPLKNCCRS